ncbi:hypothetical protein AN958_02691 [Leucoagaricus sp. SymC.cos]|nr:hypothetical protein AN958_02691 [Leucoagaricus sp. SymC.cos]
MYRVRSATAIQPLPHNRYKSKASNSAEEPPKLPLRAFPDRSGSEALLGPSQTLGTPGLKDVLKVPSLSSEHHLGFTDLLPPSPSAFTAHPQVRNHTPSGLSSSMDYRRSSSVMRQTSDSDVVTRSASPYVSNLPIKVDSTDYKIPAPSLFRPVDMSSAAVVPLDYSSLINSSREELHVELTQTIEQLAGWLGVLEGGLVSILDRPPSNVIEEERELTSAIERTPEESPLQLINTLRF